MTWPDDADGSEIAGADEPEGLRPSRSQKNRDATAVGKLGLEMIELPPSDLDLLDLSERLRDAIDACQGLQMRARSRQKRLIGQLLRASDHEAIRRQIDSLETLRATGSTRDREAQGWLAGMFETADSALQAFVEEHPDADRGRMRALMRTARQAPETPKSKRAREELLRTIRALLG